MHKGLQKYSLQATGWLNHYYFLSFMFHFRSIMEKKSRSAICYRYTTFIHKFRYISCNDIFENACEKDVLLLISVLKTVINLRIIRVENQVHRNAKYIFTY